MTASLRLARTSAVVDDSSPQLTSPEGFVTISSAALQALITRAQRETYVECLLETGPQPHRSKFITPEQADELVAKFRARYERQALERFPL